ncbi:LysE family translocator [Corynebacterium lizhenjunii]|uniref:LysE family translocator n=1 Tax=Corynebacterium lizhenjunii TaxID=2709394 RepID=A0A7T0KE01_9CORY|nr:LysE family translocator [Corynebacterium lizhenjunii]QPK78641.1 LysE family translocator [Corynebacterium lizhenjunii]
MTLSAYLTIIFANLIGALSPGPDIILLMRLATRSRRHALTAALGIQVGVLMWCTLTVCGAAALLTAFPAILDGVQVVGGAWLMWMGTGMVRAGMRPAPANLADAAAQLGSLRSTFLLGLSTNLSNPKIVLFLAALVAPMLPANPSVFTAVALILGLSLSSLLLFAVLSFAISTPRIQRHMLKAGPWIDLGAGILFLIIGLGLIVSGATGFVGAPTAPTGSP